MQHVSTIIPSVLSASESRRPACLCGGFGELRKRAIDSGYHLFWYCTACEVLLAHNGRTFQPQSNVALDDVETLPPLSERECERCGQMRPCAEHHYGPKTTFGKEDAENWAKGYLCRPCHEEWHAKMGQPIGRVL